MRGKVFLDTNILVYLHSLKEERKRIISTDLLETRDCCTSVQALNEFCNVSLKKLNRSRDEIEQALDEMRDMCTICAVSLNTIRYALALHTRYGYSYYDCVMLACALENDCGIFCSEDLSSGQTIDNRLLIINPFT
ncbi:MAG: PIN domain-containing protein [Firmicutes bacterium]|nr:PIN domain-containing protein [Bacillota bacterium]